MRLFWYVWRPAGSLVSIYLATWAGEFIYVESVHVSKWQEVAHAYGF